jgi:glycyl-tRNA synthetase beta subunit
MLSRATEDLKAGLEKQLAVESLAAGVVVEAFSTPRRLVLWGARPARASNGCGQRGDGTAEVGGV